MSEGENVRRGLYVLGDATTAELAAFANATEGDVLAALGARPELMDDRYASSGSWRYSREGRDRVGAELAASRPPGRIRDPVAAARRLETALAAIEEDLDSLSKDPSAPDTADFLDFLDLRVRAVKKSAGRLAEGGHGAPSRSIRLNRTERRLNELRERCLATAWEEPIRDVEASVERYVHDWAEHWRGTTKSIPQHAAAGPLVVVDGTTEGDDVIARIRRLALVASSPFIVISAKNRPSTDIARDFDHLGEWLSSLAGAATRVIFLVDGKGDTANDLAASLMRLDRMRASSRREFRLRTAHDHLSTVMEATLRLARLSGGDEATFVNVYEHRVSSMARQVTWAILRMVSPGAEVGRPRRTWSRPHPMSVCIDIASDARFAAVFHGSSISYVGKSELRMLTNIVSPLDGPTDRAGRRSDPSFNESSLDATPLVEEPAAFANAPQLTNSTAAMTVDHSDLSVWEGNSHVQTIEYGHS